MPRASAHTAYADVLPLWQRCLQENGLLIHCANPKAAETLRSRLNGYRAALRRHQASLTLIPGLEPQIAHDSYKVTIEIPATVRIAPRIVAHTHSITNLDGVPIQLNPEDDPGDI